MTLIKTAWSFLRTRKMLVALIILFQLGQVLLSLWLPSLNAAVIDDGIIASNQYAIWINGAIMLCAAVLQITCMVGAIYTGSRLSMEFGRELRSVVFRKVQSFSPTDQHRFGAPTLITRTTNDVTQVQTVVLMTFTVMITAPIMGIGGIVMALQQDAQLSLMLLVVVPVLGLVIGGVMYGLMPRYKIAQERTDHINTLLREQLTGVRVIRAFIRQDYEREKFNEANSLMRHVWLQIGWLWAFLMPAAFLIIGISSAAVVWFGADRIEMGAMQVGSLTAFINYLMMILGAVMMSGMMAMMFPRGEVSAQRLKEIMDTAPSIQSPEHPKPLPSTPLTFELRDAELQYEGAEEPVLSGVNLTLTPGSSVGVIGSTGSGKSSLVKLLPRLIDVTSGAVLAGGIDVRDVDPHALRERIAFVPQRPFLFSGSIASNVAGLPSNPTDIHPSHGTDDDGVTTRNSDDDTNLTQTPASQQIDHERVITALKAAQAWEFVSELEETIDSVVESGGKNFSGGQRQRLTIARALYRCLPDSTGHRQADLLIFDDSFSALDFATDAALRTSLRNYVGDVSVLLVAQRISTIRSADEILVLADGRIEARGTHLELLDTSLTYQEIVRSQLTQEEAR